MNVRGHPHRPYRNRFTAVYAALAVVLVASPFGAWKARDAGARCTPLEAAEDPIVTAIAFIRTAVERTDPAGAYGLVIPSLRRGLTCREWASGSLPVPPFRDVDWNRASYRVTAGGTGQLVLDVTLVTEARATRPGRFMLELRQVGPRWLVGFWDRADRR